jgi:hypothetical protein
MSKAPRSNWKAKQAKISLMAKQTPQQLALRRSREKARRIRHHFEQGGITSLSDLIARAVAEEPRELHGSLSHDVLRMVMEVKAKTEQGAA